MAALDREMPSRGEDTTIVAKPCASLVLVLEDPEIKTEEGETRACGIGYLVFKSTQPGAREVASNRFAFRSPVGPIEFQEIRWYLEDYFR